MPNHKYKVGDRVRYVGTTHDDWLKRPECVITRAYLIEGKPYYDIEFDVPWNNYSTQGRRLTEDTLEPANILKTDRPIFANTSGGETYPFHVVGQLTDPKLIVGYWRSENKRRSNLMIVDLSTAKVSPAYPNDTIGCSLTFSNGPHITTHVDDIDGVPVRLTRVDGVPSTVEILP